MIQLLRPSVYTPKPDQSVSIAALLDKVRNGDKRILFLGATGSGKTVIASELKRALFPAKMLFVVHRDRLIFQTMATLQKAGFPLQEIGVIAGKYQENRFAKIQIISLQTAVRRNIDWFKWEYVFFDEGHTTGFSTWGKKLAKANPRKTAIYLTATPWRLSKKECFEQLVPREHWVFAPLPGKLMEMGRLVQCRYYQAQEIDTSGVRVQAGDYALGELSVAAKDKRIVEAGLRFFKENYPCARTIVFCVDVSHAEFVEKIAKKRGRKTAIVTSNTPVEDPRRSHNPREGTREYYYAQIAAGTIDMLISVDCLSEGFDVPNIVCGWGLRPTKSPSKFYQQLGRILRTAEGKEFAVFLDQASNLLYEDKNGRKRGKFPFVEDLTKEDSYDEANFDKGDRPPARICIERDPFTWAVPEQPNGCGGIVTPKAAICPHCGYELPVRQKKVTAGEIVALNGEGTKKEKPPKLSPEELAEKEKAIQITFILKMNEAFEKRWSPGAAYVACLKKHGRRLPRNSDYYRRWIAYNKAISEKHGTPFLQTPEGVMEWLEAVDRHRGEEGALTKAWFPRFYPQLEDVQVTS